MKKLLLGILIISAAFFVSSCVWGAQPAHAIGDTKNVTLTTTVVTYLTLTITAGSTVGFGSLTPQTPIQAPATGTIASVATNAANGYTLGISDATAAPNSSMTHTDTSTHITKYGGTVGTPTLWSGNGVGITLYAADTSKDTSKWGTGTTYDDANNKYAGIPETATTAHTVVGALSGADTSSWAYEINVPNTQKAGAYSGAMTFTATAVLS